MAKKGQKPTVRHGKGGVRKRGRMLAWCQAYRARGQREKNKKAKLAKHCSRHPNDLVAANTKVK